MADVLTAVAQGIATVTFNRPDVRNAIAREMVPSLLSALRDVGFREDVRCIVFRGAGEHFSAGGDVKSFGETLALAPHERNKMFQERVAASAELFDVLDKINKPLVAIARGAVAGAGMSFVLAADFVLASDTTFFVFAHGKVGIALDSALSYYLPRVIGLRRALELTLAGARIDAQQALLIGLVSRVIPDADLDAEGGKLTAKLAGSATVAISESKRLLKLSLGNDIRRQLELEAAAVGRCAASDDFAEGVTAFLESRASRFTGR
jgi:2-(1,2-epoxy-1,2-dihydrophenyl)acetyl-CoA isomerase